MPPAEMTSITSEPESEEVTKKTITNTIAMKDVILARGKPLSTANNCKGSSAFTAV